MKQAKQYRFLRQQQHRFTLFWENRSTTPNVPERACFYRWAWQAFKGEYRLANISMVLCDEAEARQLNADYRQKDYATNVLSFAWDDEPVPEWRHLPPTLRGDVVLCPAVVAREAAEQGKDLRAHYAHLTVHGILHLMGYDHQEPAAAGVMEALEIRILNQLGYANPYAEDEL